MNYGALISEAFWLTWRNRFLWIFGFLLGGTQVFNLLQNANTFSRQRPPFFGDYLGDEAILAIVEARRFVLDNLVPFLILAILLVLVGIFLSLTSRGALVDGVAALHRGEERNFSSSFRAGLSNFWRVLGFSALVFVILLALWLPVFFIMLFSLFGLIPRIDSSAAGIATAVLAFLFFFIVVLLISVPVGIVFMLGLQALVLDREGVFGSLGSGFGLLARRPGRVLLIVVISFGLGWRHPSRYSRWPCSSGSSSRYPPWSSSQPA